MLEDDAPFVGASVVANVVLNQDPPGPPTPISLADEAGHTCALLCGNGGLDGDEQCDDGNRDDLDGCSHDCTVELGWLCEQVEAGGSSCATECGDGLFGDGGEECEDGNADSGDGCSDLCQVEDGYTCAYNEETGLDECAPDCGYGLLDGLEQCDDGTDDGDDGCLVCLIEDGYECVGEPSVCTPTVVCGDGSVGAGVECDDGNEDGGDGCSPGCTVEVGFYCGDGEPSACAPIICGDGLVMTGEECDDGNDSDGDGCSSACEVEENYSCNGEPSACELLIDEPDVENVEHRASGCCAQASSSQPPAWFVLLTGLALLGSWRRRMRRARRQ